uniref:NTPase, KAP family P-loop domain containing 1 n=1 Tax=Latimeria chalumnae TaxID=7897 RepID=H3AI06_LATCH
CAVATYSDTLSEEVYSKCLAQTLHYGFTPTTVGLYAPWRSHSNTFLKKVQGYLREEASKSNRKERKRTKQKTRRGSGKNLIRLLFLMLFYRPVLTQQQQEKKNVRYVFMRFNAWHYAGSDKLWVGLITTLCDEIQRGFGALPLSIYRTLYRTRRTIRNHGDNEEEWVAKMFLCLPLWIVTIILAAVNIAWFGLVLAVGFPTGDAPGNAITAIESISGIAVGISTAFAIRTMYMVTRNLIITQRDEIERMMNRTSLSSQLGFMSHVKEEVELITRFLQYMEIFERTKIRIVLGITQLDMCPPKNIVEALNAMNILLSDDEAPFISVLAIDPSIMFSCLENSTYFKETEEKSFIENGYEILNRTIRLPFSVPEGSRPTKHDFLNKIIKGTESLMEEAERRSEYSDESEGDEENELQSQVDENKEDQYNNKTEALIQKALECLSDVNDSIHGYIDEDIVQMRRAVNTISIAIRLVVRKEGEEACDPRIVASWVTLTNQWPYHFSWILQCIEDEYQKRNLYQNKSIDALGKKTLWEVFEESLGELYVLKKDTGKLLELDGDPELFQKILKDFQFTVENANNFLPWTVNLDRSLKRQMGLLRSSNNIKESQRSTQLQPLTQLTVFNMSAEDVCKEVDKLQFKEEHAKMYKDKIRTHELNGKAILYSEISEMKRVLDMCLGDWAFFSMHFLQACPQT